MLAVTALIIIFLDPSQPDNGDWRFTYALLAAFTLYSSILYFWAIRRSAFLASIESWSHWIDVAWFTLLIAMSNGTNQIFFFGFLFAILVASFRRGFRAGISVVFVSTLSITIISYVKETESPGLEGFGFNVYRFLLRPVYLLVLGYMIAYWGGRELTLKGRLAVLKDLTLSNPRFGVDRTVNSVLARLRRFYDADIGLLLIADLRSDGYLSYRSVKVEDEAEVHPEKITSEFAQGLLALPPELAVCYKRQDRGWWRPWNSFYAFDVETRERTSEGQKVSGALANTFDVTSLISVPVLRQDQVIGRMYFGAERRGSFDNTDVEFLIYVLEHIGPIIENIRLVDRLAADAAEQERQRIARDIHDSVIQPYIGFQLGLAGLLRKLGGGQVNINVELERLLEMTNVGIADLRDFVGGLNSSGERETSLVPAIRRFTRKFSEATGLAVAIHATQEVHLNDGLVAAAFQMVAEGLSNIRRHTEATQATVQIECDQHKLTLRIENGGTGASFMPFTPRSLTERAASLNGRVWVDCRSDGGTTVRIEVPL